MLKVAEALSRNEIVGLLADRVVAGDKMLRCDFLDGAASFPEGPFILASVLRAPVVLFSAVYCGGRQYRVRFESFRRIRASGGDGTPRRCAAARGPALCRLARSQLPRGALQLVQFL